jgi:phosphohistidine phosphatase
MRRLTLLRHGKSSWDHPGLDDHDRPLNPRGKRDAPAMGKLLRKQDYRPQIIISSTAKRARTTAALFAAELGIDAGQIHESEALYLASPADMLTVADELAQDKSDILLVGHNPGMTSLANQASDVRLDNLPTCGIISIVGPAKSWSSLLSQPGRADWCLLPKNDLPA